MTGVVVLPQQFRLGSLACTRRPQQHNA
jgi:hypothetical protein